MRVVSLEVGNLVVTTSWLIEFWFDGLVFGFIKCGVVFNIAALRANIGTSHFLFLVACLWWLDAP